MKTVAITGASGYIGKNLIAELARHGCHQIRVLSRNKKLDFAENKFGENVEIVEGDIKEPSSLRALFVPDCVVINLVYLWDAGVSINLAVTQNLLDACAEQGVAWRYVWKRCRYGRMVAYCSTAFDRADCKTINAIPIKYSSVFCMRTCRDWEGNYCYYFRSLSWTEFCESIDRRARLAKL